MAAPLITAITTVPNRENATNQASFSNDVDTFFREVNDFQTEANAQAQYLDGVAAQVDVSEAAAAASALEASGYASTAIDARDAAISSAVYKGTWEGKTSAGVIGESYSYQGSYIYRLNVNLANISTSVPSPTNTDWQLINVVPFEAPCKPTLDLDFANQDFTIYDKLGGFVKRPLADIVRQSRATAGTSTDAIGGVTEFGAGENRFTFDGKTGEALGYLSEESRINLFTYSEDFSNVAWIKENGSLSDEGAQGFKFASSTENLRSIIVQPVSVAASQKCTVSVDVKADGNRYVGLSSGGSPLNSAGGSGADGVIIFDLLEGAIHLVGANYNPSIEFIGNDYYRCSITLTIGTSSGVISPYIVDSGESSFIRQGDGVSGVLIKRAQIGAGSFPASYIKTLGTAVTRSADSMTRTLGQEWNPNEGTFVVEFDDLENVDNSVIFSVNDGTADNYTKLYQTAAGLIALESSVGGSITSSIVSSINRSVGKIKCAIALSKNSALISINGGSVSTSALANAIDLYSQLDIGHQLESNVSTVKISDLPYYPRAFDALTLQRLSRIQ